MSRSAVVKRASKDTTLGEFVFTSVEEVVAFVESVNEDERYQVQCEVLERMTQFHDRAGTLIEEVFEYVKGSGLYKRHSSEEEILQMWKAVEDIKTIASHTLRRFLNRAAETSEQNSSRVALRLEIPPIPLPLN
jgi:uncharacterized protein YgfB (UPF0149 family)